MVALITVPKRLLTRVSQAATGRSEGVYSEAWRATDVLGRMSQLAVMIDADAGVVRWLSRAVVGKRVSTRDRLMKFIEIQPIAPIPLSDIRSRWSDQHARLGSRSDGVLDDEESAGLVGAILAINPGLLQVLRYLDRQAGAYLGSGAAGELRNQERDALGVILGLARMDRGGLAQWFPPDDDVPFLAGMPSYVEREDALIDHDLHQFADWANVPNIRVGWQTFREGPRRVFVMNANRSAVEHTLGVDLVYYNETRDSFVLVQYKKMRPEPRRGGKPTLVYRPDQQLYAEMDRMRGINELCEASSGEYRLNWTASYVKLCDPDPQIEDPVALIKGMYFALDHFTDLLASCRGPNGGVRIAHDNVDRHLSNTQFIDLVRDGWIGSRGPASDTIKSILLDSLASGRAVMFGLERDDS